MANRRVAVGLLLAAFACVFVAAAWGDLTADDLRQIATTLRPYQVVSGQVASTDFEAVYVLDNQLGRIAFLKYDWTKGQLVPIAGRDLIKDFGQDKHGGYSMVSTQLSGQRGLLYVTDYMAHRAIVYQVDLAMNRVTPEQPIDLKKLFE